MVVTSELQERLLSELLEAGEENLPTLANTVLSSNENVVQRMAELKEAFSELIISALIRVAVETEAGLPLEDLSQGQSLNVIDQLDTHLIWLAHSNSWTGGARPWPLIVTTAAGKERAQAILDGRGYRWWET